MKITVYNELEKLAERIAPDNAAQVHMSKSNLERLNAEMGSQSDMVAVHFPHQEALDIIPHPDEDFGADFLAIEDKDGNKHSFRTVAEYNVVQSYSEETNE